MLCDIEDHELYRAREFLDTCLSSKERVLADDVVEAIKIMRDYNYDVIECGLPSPLCVVDHINDERAPRRI